MKDDLSLGLAIGILAVFGMLICGFLFYKPVVEPPAGQVKVDYETRVIAMLRTLACAQAAYQIVHSGRFAPELEYLASEGHIPQDCALSPGGNRISGCYFIFKQSGSDYTCYANPFERGSWKRSFFVNATGTVRWMPNADAVRHVSGGEAWYVLETE